MEARRHLSVARAGIRSIHTEVKLLRREFFALASSAASLIPFGSLVAIAPSEATTHVTQARQRAQVSITHASVSMSTQTSEPALYSDAWEGATSEGPGWGDATGTEVSRQGYCEFASGTPPHPALRRRSAGGDPTVSAIIVSSPRGSVDSPRRFGEGGQPLRVLETLVRGWEASPRWALFSPEAPSAVAHVQQTPRLSCHMRKDGTSGGTSGGTSDGTRTSTGVVSMSNPRLERLLSSEAITPASPSLSAGARGHSFFFDALTGADRLSGGRNGKWSGGLIEDKQDVSRSTLSGFWHHERHDPQQLATRFETVLAELEEERQLNSALQTSLETRESEVQARRHALETLRGELERYEWQHTSLVDRVTVLHARLAGKEGVVVKMKESVVLMAKDLADTSAMLDTILHAHLDVVQAMQAAQQQVRLQSELSDSQVRERSLLDHKEAALLGRLSALERKEAELAARSDAENAVRERSGELAAQYGLFKGMVGEDSLHECRAALVQALDKVRALEVAKKEAARRREQEIEQSSALVSTITRLYAHWLMWKINSWRTAKPGTPDSAPLTPNVA